MIQGIFYSGNSLNYFWICYKITASQPCSTQTLAECPYNYQIFEFGKKRNATFSAKIDISFIYNKGFVSRCFFKHLANLFPCQSNACGRIRICKNHARISFYSFFNHFFSIKRPVWFQLNFFYRNVIKTAVNRIKTVRKCRCYDRTVAVKKSVKNK